MVPEAGRVRLAAMLKSRSEWCISRQRVWGVPIPVFYDTSTGEPVLDDAIFRHVQALVAQHGSDVWWQRSVDELLPPEYLSLFFFL
jgi:isoleucyl-tRNA synthetase